MQTKKWFHIADIFVISAKEDNVFWLVRDTRRAVDTWTADQEEEAVYIAESQGGSS